MSKITVAIISYNPIWEKLRNTIKSIIWQKEADFEVIIADDGSENDCFDKVEQYLKEQNFTSYRLVKNIVNQGIVKNVLSAVNVATGEYIKLISPGDYLYDESTLKEFVTFADKNPAAFYFANMFYYSIGENNSIRIYDDIKNPSDLRPWKKHDLKKIRWNYLVNRDYICGAATMYNTKKFADYLNRISSFVKFTEDASMIYMIANYENAYYMNVSGGIWYEYGTGISTQKEDLWNSRLIEDNKNLFAHLLKEKLISKWIFKIPFSENKAERRFLRLIHNPKSFFLRFIPIKMSGYERLDFDSNKLKKILEQ